MKRFILFLTLVTLSYQASRSMQSAGETRRPSGAYTIIEREISDNALEIEKLTAIASDGSMAVRSLSTDKYDATMDARNILLAKERRYVVIADPVRAVSSFYMTAEAANAAKYVTISPRCAHSHDESFVGESTMLGHPVFEYAMEGKPSQGLRVRERVWRSPSLDCRQLRFLQETLDESGSVLRSFERVVKSITLGEPDPALFVMPADYREVPPSQASRELREQRLGRLFGTHPSDSNLLKGMTKMDEKYRDSQKYR